jgi:hypothetical protein
MFSPTPRSFQAGQRRPWNSALRQHFSAPLLARMSFIGRLQNIAAFFLADCK